MEYLRMQRCVLDEISEFLLPALCQPIQFKRPDKLQQILLHFNPSIFKPCQ